MEDEEIIGMEDNMEDSENSKVKRDHGIRILKTENIIAFLHKSNLE